MEQGSRKNRDLTHTRRHARNTSPVSPYVQRDEQDDFDEPHEVSLAAEYFRTVMLHRWLIGGLALAGVLVSLLVHIGTQPVYRTRTSLEVQAMNSDFMDAKSVAPTASLPSDTVLQTQMKLLDSDSLKERVKAQLNDEQHPKQIVQNDLLSRIQRVLHLHTARQIPYDDLLDETADGVKIKAIGISQLIEVTCESWDPAFAARFCNTLTSEFQAVDLESRGTQAKRISDWLVRQAAEVRQKAEEAQHRLEQAAGGNGLMLKSDTDSVGEEHLRQMQTELVRAQADRMEKQAELAEQQSGSPDGAPDSPAYAAAKLRLADLQAQVAVLVPPLTEANPKVMKLRSQIAEVQANMERERAISSSKMQQAYQAAKHREDLLSLSYKNIAGGVSSDMQKSSEIEILRREVQSQQQLYQTLLQRAKEAGFASAMPASTIRIVDAAKPPRFAIYPRHLIAAIAGALVGIVLGVVIAFLLERQMPRLRLPGDVGRFVKVEELGVIPSDSVQAKLGARLMRPVQNTLVKVTGNSTQDRDALALEANWNSEALVAEAYRSTTFSLLLAEPDRRSRILVVSSPNAHEGKTTVTTNLGIALSKSKLRVLLIDGDLRKSRLHDVMNVDNDLGLRDLLREGVFAYTQRMELVCKPTEYPNLSVMPSGKGEGSVSDLLHSPHLGPLLNNLAGRFDVVLIDTPPMLHIADARILAGHTNRILLVFRSGVTKRTNAVTVRNMLQRDRVQIAGSVLNDFDPRREGKHRYYNGYYDYYGTDSKQEVGA